MSGETRASVTTLLRALLWRLTLRRLVGGVAIALGVTLPVALVWWWRGDVPRWAPWLPLLAATIGAVGAWVTRARSMVAAARLVEGADSDTHNLVLTAAERLDRPPQTPGSDGYVETLVIARAASAVAGKSAAHYLPLRGALLGVAGAVLCWVAFFSAQRAAEGAGLPRILGVGAAVAIDAVEIEIVPPAYARRPAGTVRNPSRVEVLAGSRLRIVVRGAADQVLLEMGSGQRALSAVSAGQFVGEVTADEDGFLSFSATAASDSTVVRRLVAIGVTADLRPTVRVTAPGRDLLLPQGRGTVQLAIEAGDDIGLATLRLRYTVITGSGEQFSFTEGELPLVVQRTSATNWRATASWAIDPLGLEPGDMVVYRAVATDLRPGGEPVESDAWIVEVSSPGALATDGFAIDPDEERYAISQQMVILKTERLLARRATMSAAAFADSAAELAAEQRKVRSEFVFMMGGEVEDGHHGEVSQTELNEVAEAEGEDELAAGRMLNAGRMAIVRGIRHMSQAGSLLDVASVAEALVEERRALKEINEAFSRSRIILRALTVPERLDPARRLSGSLVEALGMSRPMPRAVPDGRPLAVQALLAAVVRLADAGLPAAGRAATAEALAERTLRIDPAAIPFQDASAALLDAAAGWRAADTAAARRAIARAAAALAADALPAAPRARRRGEAPRLDRLRGALAPLMARPGDQP